MLAPCYDLCFGRGILLPEDCYGLRPVASFWQVHIVSAYAAGISVGILEVVYEALHSGVLQIVVHDKLVGFCRMHPPHLSCLHTTACRIVIYSDTAASINIGIG